jgi:polysaccharide biosynthesis protein PelE
MTRERKIALVAGAVVAEAAAAVLLAQLPGPAVLALAALLHGLAVAATVPLLNGVAATFGLSRATPLAVVAGVFVPVLGPLGLALLYRTLGLRVRASRTGPPPTITPLPRLAASAPEPSSEHLGEGTLAARLRFARDPDARVKSVLATRHLDGARATLLQRAALRDRHEDVRLLAYALIEEREREADARIQRLLASLAAAPAEHRPTLNEQLANAYWELCYQGLVAGELEAFALDRALHHLDAAEAVVATAAARFLLRGRVLLRQGDTWAARLALEESRRRGMPARTVDAYLAEVVFAGRGRGGRRPGGWGTGVSQA